jgi:molybdopterin biosynthesis enzyme
MSRAALLAVEQWYRERVAALLTPGDPVAARIRASALSVLSSGGELTSVQRSMLTAAIGEIEQRPWDTYPHSAELLHLARLIEAAAAQDQSNDMPSRSESSAL